MAYSKVCAVTDCPEPAVARLSDRDNNKRHDLCVGHAKVTQRVYGKDVIIIAVWGDATMEDFDE